MMKTDNWNMAAISALVQGDMDNYIVAATPGGIEAQEKRGQVSFVNSATLPKDLNGTATWEQLAQVGIVRGKEADDLFVEVTLPQGWRKEGTDHSMWSDLLDEQGRKRASIFYKAAFYDRSAHMSFTRRFYAGHRGTVSGDYNSPKQGVVTDRGETIWTSERTAARDDWTLHDNLDKEAEDWLAERYPDWKNPMAYWDN